MSLKSKKINNKGIVLDVLTLMYSVIGVVIVLILAGTVWSTFVTELRATNMSDNEYEQQFNDTVSYTNQGFKTIDALLFPIAIVGLIIGLIVTSFLIPSHPIFVVVNIIGVIFLAFMGLVMQVVYEYVIAEPEIASGYSNLTYIPYVMEWLPWIGVVAVLLATIIGYSKRGGGEIY